MVTLREAGGQGRLTPPSFTLVARDLLALMEHVLGTF